MVLRLRTNPPNWQKGNCHQDVTMNRDNSKGKHFEEDAFLTGHLYPVDALEECNNIECPIREECLNFALVNNEQYGIWGGATPAQRMHMRRNIPKEEWEWSNLIPLPEAEQFEGEEWQDLSDLLEEL
jgi:hypothetical protein